jgi:hypothetical protein
MKAFFLIIMILHGLIHLMGFTKAFNYAEIKALTQPITTTSGVFWLFTSVLFILSSILWILDQRSWWIFAAVAILLSQVLILMYWKDAKAGTIANILLILPVLMAGMNTLPSAYQNRFKEETAKRITGIPASAIITLSDIDSLPPLIQKYLIYTGSIGKPAVLNFEARMTGSMKRDLKSGWTNIEAHQTEFFNEPARLFYIQSSLFGIPFDGFHFMHGTMATMQIKVASLFQVVDARGETMDHSETVTLFNDMCLLAPATLTDHRIAWETLDETHVKGTFTNRHITISAILTFNDKGELINFESNDRFLSADGKTYLSFPWSTPCGDYKDYNGRRLASRGEAIWHMPEGEFCYAKFKLVEMMSNV